MNNLVEIKYSKGEKYPKIYINGEQISRYMDLSDYIYDDIYNWADRMYQSIDDEIAEGYRIELTGHPFHYEVLKATQNMSEYCSGVKFVQLEYKIPLSDKFSYALELNDEYNAVKAPEYGCARFCTDDVEYFCGLNIDGAAFVEEKSDYYITRTEPSEAVSAKLCVVVGQSVKFFKQKGVPYVYVTEELLPLLVAYLNDYHIRLDFINSVFSTVGEKVSDETAKLEFEAFSKEEYRVWISKVPEKLDSGEKASVEIKVFPKCFADPGIVLVSDNPAVISCCGKTLVAKDGGVCSVKVRDGAGNEYRTFKITVEVHNYVSNIAIVLPATEMNIDGTLNLKCIFTPTDAEDLGEVRYSVNRENVAAINQHGELYALSAGRVCVTVSTPRVSSKVYVTVNPRAYDVSLPTDLLQLPNNAEATIPFVVVPANAKPLPGATWAVSDKRVVKIVSAGRSGCKIRSVGYGEAMLMCSLDGTGIKKVMKIVVAKEKGCYIATSVYGSYDCPEVWALRRYRDNFLSEHLFGRAFIKVYYALSPSVVKTFGKSKWFNRIWRSILDKKVKALRKKGYEDTPYRD